MIKTLSKTAKKIMVTVCVAVLPNFSLARLHDVPDCQIYGDCGSSDYPEFFGLVGFALIFMLVPMFLGLRAFPNLDDALAGVSGIGVVLAGFMIGGAYDWPIFGTLISYLFLLYRGHISSKN